MMDKLLIRKNSYYDSVTLMMITRELESGSGVENAVVVMGTEHNKELLKNIGFAGSQIEEASPNDLIIAVRSGDENSLSDMAGRVEDLLLRRRMDEGDDYCPPTLDSAIRHMPDSNLVIISLPGEYAAAEARRALLSGRHVLLFSDNVSMDDERELKRLAVDRGLLMMGPDCGTAVINHVPLAFANVVQRGSIGIVGASGTGIQEVMSQIDRLGGGVSQVIGTGGRDLKAEIGGLMMIQGINALGEDEDTRVIVLVSKPPSPGIAERVLEALKKQGKKAVVSFMGGDERRAGDFGFACASTLEDAAFKAVLLDRDEDVHDVPRFTLEEPEIQKIVQDEASRLSRGQKYLRGLFSGGTLCYEALKLFTAEIGDIFSNIPLQQNLKLMDARVLHGHSAVDLGDDEFTSGRPHPMIDSYTRQQMILRQCHDPSAAVLLLDVVLGYGSNTDPAGSLAGHIRMAKEKFTERGQYLPVIASICGTSGDPQDYSGQKKRLEEAGAIVMQSNAQAVRLAIEIIKSIKEE
jgi:succinyl-CoA synthetase alpha subunit